MKYDIGRRTEFGNPFIGKDPLSGETLKPYRSWLWDKLNSNPGFKQRVAELLPHIDQLWCPGCGPRGHNCENGICHGSVLKRAILYLNKVKGHDDVMQP